MPEHAGALAGRRVVVTRPAHQAGDLAALLRGRGAEPLHLPLVSIEDPPDGGRALAAAVEALGSDDWLVVTSPNGARRVAPALGMRRRRATGPRIAAVGGATAAAMGVPVDVIPLRSSVTDLLAELPAGPAHALVAQADRAAPTLAEGLRARGWQVDTHVAYRTVAVRPDEAACRAALAADAVVFASGSAVESWIAAIGTATPPIVVAIGRSTAEVAERERLHVHRVAADQTPDGLVVALEMAFTEQG